MNAFVMFRSEDDTAAIVVFGSILAWAETNFLPRICRTSLVTTANKSEATEPDMVSGLLILC